jgi:putative oxidoreductase
MNAYPYLSLRNSLVLLRIALAALFMAHAVVRIVNGTIPQFGQFMEGQGFPQGIVLVWCITAYEIAAGVCIALNWRTRFWATGLFAIALVGILSIHRHLGWFVGEHGTGSSEYSVALMVGLLVIAAADAERSAAAADVWRRY